MAVSGNIYDLIASLSGGEKAYIKKTAFNSNGKKELNYLQLFDAIQIGNYKTEKEFIAQNEGKPFLKNLSKNKNHLYQVLLKKLVAFHEEKDANLKLKALLSQAQVLYKRGLFKHAIELYEKLLKQCLKIEEYDVCIEVLKNLQFIYYSGNMGNKFKYSDLFVDVLQKVEKENIVFKEQSKIAELMFTENLIQKKTREGVDEILSSNSFKAIGENDSFLAKWGKMCIQTHGYYLKGEHEKAHENKIEQLRFLKDRKEVSEKDPLRFIKHLINLINGKINIKDYTGALELMPELKEIECGGLLLNYANPLKFSAYYIHELVIHTSMGNFDLALKSIEESNKWFTKNKHLVSDYFNFLFYHQGFLVHFGLKQFDKCFYYLNQIVNQKSSFRNQIQLGIQFDFLMFHFEKENYDLVESKVSGILRKILKDHPQLRGEKTVLKWFEELLKEVNSKKVLEDSSAVLKEKIKTFIKEEQWNAIFVPSLISWLESKLLGISFSEAYRQYMEKE